MRNTSKSSQLNAGPGNGAVRADVPSSGAALDDGDGAARRPYLGQRLKRFWRERVVGLIVAQFTQGVTAQKIALTVALGITLGLFPILGATTTLCAIVGVWLRLNQPVIQLVNWLASPLQLALIVVFVRIGEWMLRAQTVSFSIPEMFRKFHESPVKFMHEFGLTGLHAIIAWLVIAPLLAVALYCVLLPSLKKLAQMTAKKT